ncbi:MAG: hypothetical protein II808_01220 [Clostridia bacterium]|nr:hypothetical protein [Clostridia bacterium]
MVFAIIGENCTGKSTLASELKKAVGGEIVSGRDYYRLAKSEAEAEAVFKKKLSDAVTGENVIYVITEPRHTGLLPEGAVKILASADLDTVKERFKARMNGVLPPPVAAMLEKKHGVFDGGVYDYRYDGAKGDPAAAAEEIKILVSSKESGNEANQR